MHLSFAVSALLVAASTSVQAQTMTPGDYTIIAGQGFPNSCLPVCKPFLNQQDLCVAGKAQNKEEDCACSDPFKSKLEACAECVEQDPGVAAGMQSIVRVLCPSSSADDGTPSTSTDYDYQAGSPSSISSQIEAETPNSTTAFSSAETSPATSSSSSTSAQPSPTTSVVESTSSSSSSSSSASSSSPSAASASVAPSATPASDASTFGASVGGILGALLAAVLAL